MTAGQIVALVEVGSPEPHQESEHAGPIEALAVVALVALSGGPMDGWWFKVGDLVEHQAAAVRMHHTAADQPGAVLGYRPAGRSQRHRTRPELVADLWLWTGAPGVRDLRELADPRSQTGVSSAAMTATADSVGGNVQDPARQEVGRRATSVDDPRSSEGGRSVAVVSGSAGEGRPSAGVHRDGRTGGPQGHRLQGCAGPGGAGDGVRRDPERGSRDHATRGADEGRAGEGAGRRGSTRDARPFGDGVDQHGEREGRLDVGTKETTPSPGQRLGVDQVIGSEGQLRNRTTSRGQKSDHSPAERLAR